MFDFVVVAAVAVVVVVVWPAIQRLSLLLHLYFSILCNLRYYRRSD